MVGNDAGSALDIVDTESGGGHCGQEDGMCGGQGGEAGHCGILIDWNVDCIRLYILLRLLHL